jgi:hypothetical protein
MKPPGTALTCFVRYINFATVAAGSSWESSSLGSPACRVVHPVCSNMRYHFVIRLYVGTFRAPGTPRCTVVTLSYSAYHGRLLAAMSSPQSLDFLLIAGRARAVSIAYQLRSCINARETDNRCATYCLVFITFCFTHTRRITLYTSQICMSLQSLISNRSVSYLNTAVAVTIQMNFSLNYTRAAYRLQRLWSSERDFRIWNAKEKNHRLYYSCFGFCVEAGLQRRTDESRSSSWASTGIRIRCRWIVRNADFIRIFRGFACWLDIND